MSILITGGCGFIGLNLIKKIRKKYKQIIVVDNETLGKKENLNKLNVKFYKTDISNYNNLKKVFKNNKIKYIVHLAAHTRVLESIKYPSRTFKNNIVGTFNLLLLSKEFGVDRFINASTGGAIMGNKKPPITEKMFPNPLSIYGGSKFFSEILCNVFKESYNISSISLRFSNIYGPNSFHKESAVSLFIKEILSKRKINIYGNGEQTRDFLYIDDLVNVIVRCIDNQKEGVYQLGTGRPTTINRIVFILKKLLEKKNKIRFDVNYLPKRKGEVQQTWCDISKSKKELNFYPKIPIEKGIEQTIKYFLKYENNWFS